MEKHNDNDGDDEHLLVVAKRGELALNKPRFIVKRGEKYYLTFGAWEYDASKAENERQKAGCKEIKELFEQSSKVEAADVPPSLLGASTATATHPHDPVLGPPRKGPRRGGKTDLSTPIQ